MAQWAPQTFLAEPGANTMISAPGSSVESDIEEGWLERLPDDMVRHTEKYGRVYGKREVETGIEWETTALMTDCVVHRPTYRPSHRSPVREPEEGRPTYADPPWKRPKPSPTGFWKNGVWKQAITSSTWIASPKPKARPTKRWYVEGG